MTTVGAGCSTPAEHAESATVHAFLNCYLRETNDGDVIAANESPVDGEGDVVRLSLDEQGMTVFAPLRYESATGRHLFDLPVYTRGRDDALAALDAGSLAALVCRELALAADGENASTGADLLRRVLVSRAAIERFVGERSDLTQLCEPGTTFRDAEQSLLYGHLLHPTPKSREGISPHDVPTYAPELAGSFQLRYFAADPSIVTEWSARDGSASEWVQQALADDRPPAATAAMEEGRVLVPTHPWQADHLRSQEHVEVALSSDELVDLGTFGPTFYPTTSVRTLWSPDAPFMVKGSLAVEITNAERTNKRPELARGVAVSDLLETEFGDRLHEMWPRFRVVEDPAALTLELGEGPESGFETVLRENPFRGSDAANVSPVVALCQDGVDGPSRLARVVRDIAERTGRPEDAVAREWFREYLAVTVRPILWTYFELGVGMEAHQQNTLLRLNEAGWPAEGYYRDNQGYYFPESRYERVDAWLPGVGDRAGTICPDSVADERLRYYIICNNAFGVVNALGVAGLAPERALLDDLRSALESLRVSEPPSSELVSVSLTESQIPCKGNLLTRFRGLDELEESLENQSVYVDIENPIVTRT
ncbi:iron transporter (plasmid) [Halostagnicola larsenii XH-48]|uniref:Iron transporter n=1 Tax=Halostagnicola larsenii XH-48 TaxID=797299 RepID=W0JW43_9EURY|nr:IucA/IucC family protein [Halostagnicola larsenii]AHG01475.1 iron transporter [Halostagnicola larsenii XH-48]